MKQWQKIKLCDALIINPIEKLPKGIMAKKISMEKLLPFHRDILEYEYSKFSGGSKFRNNDTIMARITPCLENGKRAKVGVLNKNEIGFGSTEFIVFRKKENISDADFIALYELKDNRFEDYKTGITLYEIKDNRIEDYRSGQFLYEIRDNYIEDYRSGQILYQINGEYIADYRSGTYLYQADGEIDYLVIMVILINEGLLG